jgi:hypothetical protein
MKLNPQYRYPEKFKEQVIEFFNSYDLENEVACPNEKITGLTDKKLRVCRFCGLRYPKVTFTKDAHIIPELLGNRFLVSGFECDECNYKFGKYENDLAHHLSITRTMQSVKGKNKVPKFKSADNTLKIENIQKQDEGNIVEIRRFDRFNQTFEFDKENNQTLVRYKKPPFTPLKVYKSLLKIALSCIAENYVDDYKFAFEYLRTNKYDKTHKGFETIASYRMPLTYSIEKPVVMIFKKRDSTDRLFTHVFAIFTLNFIYQLVIPFNKNDFHFYQNNASIETLWCPPLFGREYTHPLETIRISMLDLSSNEKMENTYETLVFPMIKNDNEKVLFKDKITGKVTKEDFDGNKIVGFDLMRIDDDTTDK